MLHTRHAPTADALAFPSGVELVHGRAHEATGTARTAFALLVAARLTGPVLWLQPLWTGERPAGDGLRALLEPGRLVIGRGRTVPDLLWAAEEALRTGVVPLVVLDLPDPPALTPVRRLHLAAETGAQRGAAPLALLLTPGTSGSPGVETRWRFDPAPGWARDGLPRWRLTRLRARVAPEADWEAALVGGTLRLDPMTVR